MAKSIMDLRIDLNNEIETLMMAHTKMKMGFINKSIENSKDTFTNRLDQAEDRIAGFKKAKHMKISLEIQEGNIQKM